MKYCPDTTRKHPVAVQHQACLITINDLLSREGSDMSIQFSPDVLVLDMDCVEACVAKDEKRSRESSMDSAFCIRHGEKQRVMLVEYKLNHDNFNWLKKVDLESKVSGSKNAIGNSMNIYYYHYFVVKEHLFQQARNRLNRMNPKPGNEYLPITVRALKDEYF